MNRPHYYWSQSIRYHQSIYHSCHYYSTLNYYSFCCPRISLLLYYVLSIHDFRIVYTCQMWPCIQYICMINVQVLVSYYARGIHDSIVSIDTSETINIVQVIELDGARTTLGAGKLTRPHTGHRPASLPLFAASCIELVTKP